VIPRHSVNVHGGDHSPVVIVINLFVPFFHTVSFSFTTSAASF
jgi:hypothetical protein